VNKKDCIEYDSCMQSMKVCKANETVLEMTNDPDTNELVIDLHCDDCDNYKTTSDY